MGGLLTLHVWAYGYAAFSSTLCALVLYAMHNSEYVCVRVPVCVWSMHIERYEQPCLY